MAKASTEKRTKLEPSEIFAVVGMLMKTKKIQDLCINPSGESILEWLSEGKKLASSAAVKYGSSKEKYLSFFNEPKPGKNTNDLIANVVAGFSASIGIKKFIQRMVRNPGNENSRFPRNGWKNQTRCLDRYGRKKGENIKT